MAQQGAQPFGRDARYEHAAPTEDPRASGSLEGRPSDGTGPPIGKAGPHQRAGASQAAGRSERADLVHHVELDDRAVFVHNASPVPGDFGPTGSPKDHSHHPCQAGACWSQAEHYPGRAQAHCDERAQALYDVRGRANGDHKLGPHYSTRPDSDDAGDHYHSPHHNDSGHLDDGDDPAHHHLQCPAQAHDLHCPTQANDHDGPQAHNYDGSAHDDDGDDPAHHVHDAQDAAYHNDHDHNNCADDNDGLTLVPGRAVTAQPAGADMPRAAAANHRGAGPVRL